MNEYPSKVLIVFFNAVVELLDMSLIQKAQDLLLELSAAFAWDDLNEFDLADNGFFDDAVQFRVNLIAFVVDLVQV